MDIGASQAESQAVTPWSLMPRRLWPLCLLFALLLGFAIYILRYDLRGYALLTRFADPQASGLVLRSETYPITTDEISIPTANGPVRARLYLPVGVAHPRGMVAVHGIHHLGMDEPRLMSFSSSVAESGLAVLTPQIDSLADYHVDQESIPIIGQSAAWLDQHLGKGPVTVTGISFAGGLSL